MSRTIITFFAYLLFYFAIPTATFAGDDITLNLPESVLAEAITAILPLEIDATSKTLQGTITILSVSDFKLTDGNLICRLHLAGNKLQFLTEVAGHEIRLKVGSVEIDFKTKARLRFDAKNQTLFIRPIIDDVQSSKDATGGDIGHALVSLLNGREFPVEMQDLDPLVAKTGTKILTITMKIADVQAKKGQLQLSFTPKVTSN